MADFSALKTSIQNYIKQNGNEEITGNLLQKILLSMVSTLGDSAINDLVTALNAEIANRGNADTELGGRITTLQGVVNGIKANVENGYVYAGIATPSTTPVSGKVFYLALTAGTYTNFGATEVPQGINILKYNGSAWSLDSFLGLDDAPTQGSNNLVKSDGVLDSIIKDGSAFNLSAYNSGATYDDLSAALTALNVLPAAYKKGGMSIKYVQTSDNKYVQYRLMANQWSTTESDWQGVDEEPTAGSENLVKSGSVAKIEQYIDNFGAFPFLMHGYALVDNIPVYQTSNPNVWSLIRFDNVIQGEIVSLYNVSIADVILINTNDVAISLDNEKTWDGTYWNIVCPSNGIIFVKLYAPDNSYTKSYLLNYFGDNGIKRTQRYISEGEMRIELNNLIVSKAGIASDKGISQKAFSDMAFQPLNSIDYFAQYGKFINPTTHEIGDANFTLLCIVPVKAGETIYVPHFGGVEYNHNLLHGDDNSWVDIDYSNIDNDFVSWYVAKDGYMYIDLRSATDFWWESIDLKSALITKTSQNITKEDAKAISMLLSGTKGKVLSNKTLYANYNNGILKNNAQKDTGHDNDYFFTDMICRNGNLSQQKPLVIECELMNIHNFYSTVFLFDSNNNFIVSINLSGKQTFLLDPYYKLILCSSNASKGTIFIGEPGDLIGNDYHNSGTLVWVGTSIPAGAGYPEDVQAACGYRVYNQAIGGSPLVSEDNILALALSMQEKIALGIAQSGDTEAENSSYENRLMPYINGTTASVNAIVFDHGYNDTYILYEWFKSKCIEKNLITQESDFINQDGSYKTELVDQIDDSWIDWQPLKTSWTASEKNGNFFSSFLFLRYTLLSANPYLKFIMVSHLENKSCRLDSTASWSGMLGKLVCKCQQVIAEHFSYPFLNIAELTGWSKWTAMPNSTRQIVDDYNQATGQSALVYWINANGEISTFQYFCPDGVHPQSDLSGHTRKYLSQLFIRELDKLI